MSTPQRGAGDWRDRMWAHPWMATDRRLRWMGGVATLTGFFVAMLGFDQKQSLVAWLARSLLAFPGAFLFCFGVLDMAKQLREFLGAKRWVAAHANDPTLLARVALAGDPRWPNTLERAAADHLDAHHSGWRRQLVWHPIP